MQTMEQIEHEVKQLSKAEQLALAGTLASLLANGGTTEDDARRTRLQAFFAEWDATHSVTVGEKPTRERTYADTPRLR